jgi:hypothetical protein
MQQITRALNALARGAERVWRFWIADIQKRKSFGGKVASIGIGLFAICCLCSVGLGAVRSAGQAVGIVPTNTPTLPPTATFTPGPTNTPEPTRTPEPPRPTETPKPSPTPEPTNTPRPTSEPSATPVVEPQPAAAPAPAARTTDPKGIVPQGKDCPVEYPIKGNFSSSGEKIYHVPGGQFYNRTNPERCFATAADARAAGFRASQR